MRRCTGPRSGEVGDLMMFVTNNHCVVSAYPNARQRLIPSPNGSAMAMPGDWIIVNPDGVRYPVKYHEFRRDYRPIGDAARAAWETVYGEEGGPTQ